jgi:hypothetical protein
LWRHEAASRPALLEFAGDAGRIAGKTGQRHSRPATVARGVPGR